MVCFIFAFSFLVPTYIIIGRRSGTPQAVSMPASTEPTTRWATSHPTFSPCAPRRRIHPACPCSPRQVDPSVRASPAELASAAPTRATRPQSSRKTQLQASPTVEAATSNLTFSQSDRLRRRSSFGSASVAGASDLGSLSQYDYKSQDDIADLDDMKSQYAGTQSGVTVF